MTVGIGEMYAAFQRAIARMPHELDALMEAEMARAPAPKTANAADTKARLRDAVRSRVLDLMDRDFGTWVDESDYVGGRPSGGPAASDRWPVGSEEWGEQELDAYQSVLEDEEFRRDSMIERAVEEGRHEARFRYHAWGGSTPEDAPWWLATREMVEGRDGMLAADAHLVELLEEMGGPESKGAAAKLRKRRRAAWSELGPVDRWGAAGDRVVDYLWGDEQRAARVLVTCVWRDVVLPQVQRERAQVERAARVPPAMLLPFAEGVDSMRDARLRDRSVVSAGEVIGQLELLPRGVPVTELGLLEVLSRQGFDQLASLNFERVVYWLPQRARELAFSGSLTSNVIRVGSWRELAATVFESTGASKAPSCADVVNLKRLLVAMYEYPEVAMPDGSTSKILWLAWGEPRTRDDDQFVRITLPDAWLPWTAPDIPRRGRASRYMRALAPVIPPPPGLGGTKGHAWQAALSRRLVLAMSQRRGDLREAGALELGPGGLVELAMRCETAKEVKRSRVIDKLVRLAKHWAGIGHMELDLQAGRVVLGEQHEDVWKFLLTEPKPVSRPQRKPRK